MFSLVFLAAVVCCRLLSSEAWPTQNNVTASQILTYMDEYIFSEKLKATLRMTVMRDGKENKMYLMEFFKQGTDKTRIEFLEPAIEKGRRLLNDGDALWMYLPRSSKTIRLASKQAFMGSDASNRDLLNLSLARDYTGTMTAGEMFENQETYLLTLKAKDPSVAYDQIKLWVRKEDLAPLYQEFVTLSGRTLKSMRYEKIEILEGHPFAKRLVITNALIKNSVTILEYSSVQRRHNKQDSFFTIQSLRRN